MLTRLTCDLRYEMRIAPQKKSSTNHKAQGLISQCQMIKIKIKIKIKI
jgi:hypothetical protein